MNDFITSPPLPEPPGNIVYSKQETVWQRDQLKLALDEMAALLYYCRNRMPFDDDIFKALAKHGYLPRKEPK